MRLPLVPRVIGIFFVPAIFYLVEKWSGAGKEHASGTSIVVPPRSVLVFSGEI